jgi:hypothetical protein
MVLSSHAALNKVGCSSMRELKEYINSRLAGNDCTKPLGLHFVLDDKIFKGTNQPHIQCPIQFLLRGNTKETMLCRPVWTEQTLRSKVNRKAKVGVKKHSVIRLDDFSVVLHNQAPSGYLVFIRSYLVVKKDIKMTAYQRWILE